MLIQRIKISNFKTYLSLDLDLTVDDDRPIILIGGSSLQITFVGKVLGQQQKYILKRNYILNPQGRPLESVSLNMNGNMYVYGTMTAPKERVRAEQEISKIIKANLPQEFSQ